MTTLFLPGFMLDKTLWHDMTPHLTTPGPFEFPELDTGTTIPEMAQTILDNAPDTFSLVGFSMGGFVAREIVRQAPHRIRKLVLIATSAREDSPERTQQKNNALRQVAAMGYKGLSRSSISISLHPSRSQDDRLIDIMHDMSIRLGRDVFELQASIDRRGDLSTLSQITPPTLVIAADGDRLRSLEESEELVAGIPDSRLVVVKGSGHMIPLEAPQELAEILSGWLSV